RPPGQAVPVNERVEGRNGASSSPANGSLRQRSHCPTGSPRNASRSTSIWPGRSVPTGATRPAPPGAAGRPEFCPPVCAPAGRDSGHTASINPSRPTGCPEPTASWVSSIRSRRPATSTGAPSSSTISSGAEQADAHAASPEQDDQDTARLEPETVTVIGGR